MIVNPLKYLKYAQKARFAIGHFNAGNIESAISIIIAAEEKNAPVFLAITDKTFDYLGLELNKTLVDLAKNSKAPIALHYDHGKNFKTAKKCLLDGYKSIMFDGSDLAYDMSIRQSRKFVQTSHLHGGCCELELGHVTNSANKNVMTDPDLVADFCKKTKTDTLAVSVGNTHGMPTKKEKINFDLIKIIQKNVNIPLVYHGASSTPPADVKKLIKCGITKINIDTDLREVFTKGLEQYLKNHPDEIDYRKILGFASLKIKKAVEYKINIFGSTNKS